MSRSDLRFLCGRLFIGALLLFAGLLAAPTAHAQDRLTDGPFNLSLELNGGAATYGHFLEFQDDGREKELTAETGLSLGAALGARLFERNVVRLSFDYLPGSFEFQDDTGDNSEALDAGSASDFNLFALSLEAERTFFQFGRFAPYASVGFSAGWWNLDEGGDAITAGDSETLFRWGSTSGVGVRVELSPSFYLNFEANSLSLGNPFDGADAFRVTNEGDKMDEPTSVSALRLRGGLRYIF